VHDVVFGKEDDGVAVGVTGRKVERADIFAVEMDGDVMFEGDDGRAAFSAGFTSILTDPPLPAVPPEARRLRTLSCAMTVEPEVAKGAFPPAWSP